MCMEFQSLLIHSSAPLPMSLLWDARPNGISKSIVFILSFADLV